MAEMVSSAVVQEAVSQILSGLVHKCEGKEKSNANENMERLEMAHIRLEAALEISNKWLITDASLLRWRKKLKLAAQQCYDALHKCKQRILEEEQIEQEVRNSSFPKRMAHATKSFILSSFSSNKDESSRSVIRRFEWFAHGASEFLRFAEHGGSLRCHMPVHSMIKHIFAGNELRHKIVQGSEYRIFLLSVVPFRNAEHGIETGLAFIHKDGSARENDFFLSVMLQISESTDIIDIIIKCLQLYTIHFRSAVEIIRKELTQLPMQDFSWVPSCVDLCQKEHWDNLHSFSSQWFRPNPLCCKKRVQHNFCHNSKVDRSGLQDVSLESVIEVNLQCQVLSSEYNKQRTSMFKGKCLQDSPHLKVGLVFTPHGISEDRLLADRSSELVMIDGGEEQKFLHTDMTLDRLEEILLPKAIDYFSQNSEATAYRMLWKSKCGSRAYIQVEKTSIFSPRTRRTFGAARKRKLLQQQDKELASPNNVISHFLDLWATQAPNKLQASIMDWNQKEKEEQLAPELPCLKSRLGEEAEIKMEMECSREDHRLELGFITENKSAKTSKYKHFQSSNWA